MLKSDLAIGGVSVCLSVCLSHGVKTDDYVDSTVSYPSQRLVFRCQLSYPRSQRKNESWVGKNGEKADFRASKSQYLRNDRR